MKPAGHVYWLFGLSGAGKSTLAEALRRDLENQAGRPVLMLDGDRLRGGLCRGLGFSDLDRAENLRRAAEVARLGVESGLVVISAFITPLEAHRDAVVATVGAEQISLIHVHASLRACQERDVKGLYAGGAVGGAALMTGLGSVFEAPAKFFCQISTDGETPETSSARLWRHVSGAEKVARVRSA